MSFCLLWVITLFYPGTSHHTKNEEVYSFGPKVVYISHAEFLLVYPYDVRWGPTHIGTADKKDGIKYR